MGFFDLNIPYHESDRRVTDTSSLKGRRLKLALKAMELGFTGVAYNRTLKGVMSESDRCSTNIFPLSKLAASSSSSFVAAVKFHRELLNVNVSSPFRQYTRLTVIADYPAQLSTLKAGNPVLKSYDIVAVRPMSKETFEQACQTSEVDMIVIDFSDNLPFTLRQPMVKAAIKRGVYFEITYSGLISDAQSRRRLISNSKLLVDWTRGQNLIISSAARSTTELRGPQDVANLFSLLALPMDRAKAAISRNCRSLLTNALRKKHFYKEAVKVERIPLCQQVNPEKSAFDDWLKWDPISSGEGDLLLEDMEKSFAISNNVKETIKTIDFTASLNGLPAHGLHIKDLLPATDTSLKPPITDSSVSAAMEIDENAAFKRPVVQGDLSFSLEHQSTLGTLSKEQGRVIVSECQASYSGVTHLQLSSTSQDFKSLSHGVFEDKAALSSPQNQVQTPFSDAHIRCEASGLEESALSSLPPNDDSTYSDETLLISMQKANSTDLKSKVLVSETKSQGNPSFVYAGHILCGDGQVHTTKINGPITDDHADVGHCNLAYKYSPSAFHLEQTNVGDQCEDVIYGRENVAVEKVPKEIYCDIDEGKSMASPGISPQNALVVREQCDMINKSVTLGGGLAVEGSSNTNTNSKEPILLGVTGDRNGMNSLPNYQGPGGFQSGRGRRQTSLHKPLLSPFKRFLSPRLSKKKSRKKLKKPLTSM